MGFPLLAHWAGESIEQIDPAALAGRGIRLLLADLDNTLVPYGVPEPDDRVRAWRAALEETLAALEAQPQARRRRIVDGMFTFAACADSRDAAALAAAMADKIPLAAEASGRKVYFFPPGVDKGTALRRAAERFGLERIIAAGDSVIDVPMLRRADLALLPGPELLPQLPGAQVCGPDQRFPDFVLETVLRQAAPAET